MKREHREFRDGDIEEEIREAFQVVFQSSLSKFFQSSLCKVSNHPYTSFSIIPVHFIQLIIYPYQLLTVVVTHSLGLIEIAQI